MRLHCKPMCLCVIELSLTHTPFAMADEMNDFTAFKSQRVFFENSTNISFLPTGLKSRFFTVFIENRSKTWFETYSNNYSVCRIFKTNIKYSFSKFIFQGICEITRVFGVKPVKVSHDFKPSAICGIPSVSYPSAKQVRFSPKVKFQVQLPEINIQILLCIIIWFPAICPVEIIFNRFALGFVMII